MLGGVGVQMREMRTEGMMVSTLRWDEDQESRLKTSEGEVGRDGGHSHWRCSQEAQVKESHVQMRMRRRWW